MEGPESFPKGAVLARLKEVKGAPIFATKQSQNQLKEDGFWPLKHGLQQHKRMEKEGTSFLKKLTRKRCLGVDQGAPIKRSEGGGALVLGGLDMYEEKRGRLIILFI